MCKEKQYEELMPQIEALIESETDMIANMANVAAVIHETFGFWWTGFYLVKPTKHSTDAGDTELVLGPFQGPVACTRIQKSRGVCGSAWQQCQTIIVKDVHQFPGHIACSSESKSEIVVPIKRNNEVIAVLDIDSSEYNTFDEVDKQYLERIADMLI